MKSNRQFVIPFKGLKTGKHDFVFDIDDRFFDDFEQSEITKGKIHVDVELDKKSNMLEFHFRLFGGVYTICDRCLDELELPVEYATALFVNFGDETEEQTDEIIVLSHNEFELDLSQYIYEFVHLSLPYKRVHSNDKNGKSTCNEEMLKRINGYAGNEYKVDSRWDDLKNIINN